MRNFIITIFCAFVIIVFAFPGFSQVDATWYKKNQEAIDTLRRGKFVINIVGSDNQPIEATVTYSMINHEFPWGTALNLNSSNEDIWYTATARKFFNSGVPENIFKWSYMQPNPGPVNYNEVDYYIEWCKKAGWELRGHCLLWGSKNYEDFHTLQKWVKDLPPTNMYDTCKVRVQREVSHYKGLIKEYDVLNEPIPGHADWLQKTVGDSINWNSFKWAREMDADAKLFINEYGIIAGSDYKKYLTLIQTMLDNGAPIDGIGVQGHFGGNLNPYTIKYVLDTLSKFGIPIKVTEFDMGVGDNNMTEAKQANYYSLMVRTAFAHPGVSGFLFWGFWDAIHWRNQAGIFTEGRVPKIAADSLYRLIHSTWTTQGQQMVSSTIPLEVTGYFGDYEIEIDYQGETRVMEIPLHKINKGDTLTIDYTQSHLPAPKIVNAIAFDEKHINLYFNAKITASNDQKDAFKVVTNDNVRVLTLWQPEEDSTQVILEIDGKINFRNYITTSYFPGTVAGSNGEFLKFYGSFEVENRVPGFKAGYTNSTGDSVLLEFSESLETPDATEMASFKLTLDNQIVPITKIGLVEDTPSKIYLLMNTKIEAGQVVKTTYNPGQIETTKQGVLGAFGPKLLANYVGVGIANSVFDKNNVIAFYNPKSQNIVISNRSFNHHDFNYKIYNPLGYQLFTGTINYDNDINIDAANLKAGLIIVKFENTTINISNSTKIIIEK